MDRPILHSAVDARALFLLTGDFEHFGSLFGKKVRGVMVHPVAQYLALRKTRGQNR